MPNPLGENGTNNGTKPNDDVLREALLQYAREGLTRKERLSRLDVEFGYKIGRTKLTEHNKEFNVPSVRDPPPLAVATSLICEKMGDDPGRRNGPSTVKKFLALDGHQIPRATVRQVMHSNDPYGPAIRYPGSHKQPRTPLLSPGVFAEVSCDGHEKFGSFALALGPVGIPVYGMRDKWSGAVLSLVAVPNARKALVIGHVYLDFVQTYGAIPIKITVDHGSETGDMYSMQKALRNNFAPDLDEREWPSFTALTSTKNISIESLWSQFRKQVGINVQEVLLEGRSNGLFNPNYTVHVNLFLWLWPQIIQARLDSFKQYWNSHRVRKQKDKRMPSGSTPMDFFIRPEHFGGERLSIPVPRSVVQQMRDSNLSISREEAFKWVDDEFAEAAAAAYADIGYPAMSVTSGWQIFSQMSELLEAVYDDDPTIVYN